MAENKLLYSTESILEDYIHINSCALLDRSTESSRNVRPVGRKDYMLLYVKAGRCYLNIDSDNPKIVEKGNVILYKPNVPQDYSFIKTDKPIQLYIHFTGTGCERILEKANLTDELVITPHKNNELENYLEKICEEFDNTDSVKTLLCEGLLIAALSLISKNNSSPTFKTKYTKALNNIIGSIRTDAHLTYDIKTWASQCGLTEPHFIQVFKKATGLPPYQFLTKIRIQHAKELLLFSDLSVSQIGELCGYSDYNYFARIFKKKVGVSPSDYRLNTAR